MTYIYLFSSPIKAEKGNEEGASDDVDVDIHSTQVKKYNISLRRLCFFWLLLINSFFSFIYLFIHSQSACVLVHNIEHTLYFAPRLAADEMTSQHKVSHVIVNLKNNIFIVEFALLLITYIYKQSITINNN